MQDENTEKRLVGKELDDKAMAVSLIPEAGHISPTMLCTPHYSVLRTQLDLGKSAPMTNERQI
jgi:hypothetical protein